VREEVTLPRSGSVEDVGWHDRAELGARDAVTLRAIQKLNYLGEKRPFVHTTKYYRPSGPP